jgi:hypothetical protein
VDKTIMEADKDGDGKLSFEEFTNMVASTDIVKYVARSCLLGLLVLYENAHSAAQRAGSVTLLPSSRSGDA